ncbi:MAG: hypothetical protein WDN08_07915 [Rhizomicrobium sp.]
MSVANDKKTPAPKLNKQKLDEKVDQQTEDSFPASDPPSYSGGNHIVGAPQERESDCPTADSHAVKEAEKKVKSGDAAVPHTY